MLTLHEKIQKNAEERLVLPADRKPSEELPRYKNFLKVETQRLKILHRGGGDGREVCQARSLALDTLLCYILDGARRTSAELKLSADLPFALVALGGYGRGELNPYSDIDILFLHDGSLMSKGKPLPSLKALTESMLYTLWDVGLKVGHATRSIDECVSLANEDMQTKTALIEARLINGSEDLFKKFQKAVLTRCVAGHEDEYVQMRLADQAARRAKFGGTPLLQEPNIKNGCGGLRDYQNLIWMTFFKFRTRSLQELQDEGMIYPAERKQLEAAYDFHLRARNELHYHVGRPVDVLTKSVQPSVAHNLGYTDRSPSVRLEQFMRDFYTHARNIDFITRMVERRLALVPQPEKKGSLLPNLGKMFRKPAVSKTPEQTADGFRFVDGEIHATSPSVFRDRPWRLMRVFLHAQQRNLKLHPDLAQLLSNQLHLVNNAFLRDEHVRATFLEILDQRGNVAPVLRAMHEVGFLGKFLPEFGHMTCLVQHEFFHQYTADEHTLMCITKLDQIWDATQPPFSGYTEIFQKLEKPYVLYLTLLLHDAGKGFYEKKKRGLKHEKIGEEIARKTARRLGLGEADTRTLCLLVENHLTMALLSQRRDLDDQEVIRGFAGIVQNVETLNMLTLHTFADSMGTSDQLWNGFKDSLLWQLHHKAHDVIASGGQFAQVEVKQREQLAEEVSAIMPRTFTPEELYGHFDAMPLRYFQINNAKEILGDLAQVHRFMGLQVSPKENALSPVVSWHNEPDRGYAVVSVCTWDRPGLFAKINGALTAAGLNILSAEIMTRADNIALDSFFVTDGQTGLLPKREEREKFEEILGQILTGEEVDLDKLIAKQTRRASVYKALEGEKIPTLIHFDNEISRTQTVLDVETEDHLGLLYAISQVLTECDLNISLAKVLTEKGAAIDTFYFADSVGHKIVSEEYQRWIERKLKAAIARLGK